MHCTSFLCVIISGFLKNCFLHILQVYNLLILETPGILAPCMSLNCLWNTLDIIRPLGAFHVHISGTSKVSNGSAFSKQFLININRIKTPATYNLRVTHSTKFYPGCIGVFDRRKCDVEYSC